MSKPKFFVDRDPRVFAANRKPAQTGSCLALAIDPGTSAGCSLAWFTPGTPAEISSLGMISGIWDLSAGPYDTGAIRFVRMRQFLAATAPDIIFYEDVKSTPPNMKGRNVSAILARDATAKEFMGALKGVIAGYAEELDIPAVGIPIGSIKRRATRKGNASKEEVIVAANEEFGVELNPETYKTTGDDNVADSMFILALGLDEYMHGAVPNVRNRR